MMIVKLLIEVGLLTLSHGAPVDRIWKKEYPTMAFS